jgi:hypothetical protein
VRKLSKVSSKLVGITDKSWVRIPAPRFVTSVTLQPRAPIWPLKNSSAPFAMRVLPTNRRSLSGPGVILDPDRIQRTSCIASDARHVDARIPRLQTLSLLPLTLGDRLRSSCDAILETKSPRPIGHQMQVTRRRAYGRDMPLDDFATLDRTGKYPTCTLSASTSRATKFAC